jgi:hypothetical protein
MEQDNSAHLTSLSPLKLGKATTAAAKKCLHLDSKNTKSYDLAIHSFIGLDCPWDCMLLFSWQTSKSQ